MSPVHHEVRFEDAIEADLMSSGWLRGTSAHYQHDLALDTSELFAFIGATQAREWDRLRDFFADADEAQHHFARRVADEIEQRGALDVLRHGVKDRGQTFRLAYFRPEHTLADDALVDYENNRLTVTRQLRYSTATPDRALDLALFVNGIPVATAELKNPLTGQTVEHAKHQYRTDRDPNEPIFRRTLVHFAVDPDLVFLTTRLAGRDTQFLPFNLGTAGPGESGGAGNPSAHDGGYRTAYLWQQIWAPDTWLDLLRRFVHVEAGNGSRRVRKKAGPATTIFPRFHQWHAVTELVDHARRHGPGQNYLVMHSAGSGKSNSIAWLAHRLSSLHAPDDTSLIAPNADVEPNKPVFDKVIVITDRDVLDRQLQDTIYQFEHASGVVRRISDSAPGSKSQQVADALADATSKIIIVTVQTFPYVLDLSTELRGTRFAVIVDEAHSSQSGDSATALKKVLGKLGADDVDEDADPLTASALARGRHPNLSYFAFTATPKPKTLELFGVPDPVTGNFQPFHVYSMRQAIEEGFILDVIRNYVTYATYWRLANANAGDPEVDEKKAGSALARFVSLHETTMNQRAEVIVEHFRTHTRDRLGGRAKAMAVTRSREHAVRLYRAVVDYIDMRGYDFGTLVAFSGELDLGDGDKVTESKINGLSEKELPAAFGYARADDPHAAAAPKTEYRILVVADKYQTGFDQPLLTTMYVDKKLHGVAAVQTLSRLNRIHPRKSQDDIFVLDFANDADDVLAAFRPYYEEASTTPTDPNLLYTAEREVMDFALLVESEMDAFARAYLDAQRAATSDAAWKRAHADLYRFTDPAVERFNHLHEEDAESAEEFRAVLRDYVRKYGFLAQVVPYNSAELERLYLYGKHLLNRLPPRANPGVDIGMVDLTHLRITKTGEYDLHLDPEGEQVLPGFSDGPGGAAPEPDRVPLSVLIDEFNQRFGTDLDESDIVAPRDAAMADRKIRAAAHANDLDGFAQVFDDVFEDKVYDRIEQNTTFLKRFADNSEFRSELTKLARRQAYEMIRGAA